MPTDNEWTELQTKCTWTWTTQGGKKGYKVTSKTTGNSIFLPAAGYRHNTNLYDVGSNGNYWSSSLRLGYTFSVWCIYCSSAGVQRHYSDRYIGKSIRPVSK